MCEPRAAGASALFFTIFFAMGVFHSVRESGIRM